MHDTFPRELLEYEIELRRESGYDTTRIDAIADQVLADRSSDDELLLEVYASVLATTRRGDWPYVEPDDLESILATLPSASPVDVGHLDLRDKLLGGWAGRAAGCNLGKPIELGDYWTVARIRRYLELVDAWPLEDYIPALTPPSPEYELRDCWPSTTRGNVVASSRDDDLDYTLLALHLIETYGRNYTSADVAREWLARLPYTETFTAERAAYRSLINGVPPHLVGELNNPYREWIGAQIRADLYGYINPGNPRAAAVLAYQDAALSHRGNGIYGEMWSAALVAAAFTADTARDAIVESLQHIPPRSRLAEALNDIVSVHASHASWDESRAHIERTYGHYSWIHTISNALIVAAGLLWGDGDYTASIALTVVGGWDTDSNGATSGSVAGVMSGAAALPPQWIKPLNDTIRSSLAGFDGVQISDLADRTLALIPGSNS